MDVVLQPADLSFLDEQRVARLGTIDDGGRPHVLPVCFARIGSRLYVPVDAKPKRGDPRRLARLRHLRARPAATLLIDRYDEDWRRLRWLMITAAATILEDGAERVEALHALEERYPQYVTMGLSALGLPVIALTPAAARRWAAAPNAGADTRHDGGRSASPLGAAHCVVTGPDRAGEGACSHLR